MATHITILDGHDLKVMELVGDSAIKVAEVSLRDTRPASIATFVAGLLPFLAPAARAAAASNGDTPYRPPPSATRTQRSKAEKMQLARDYVGAHPGATITEIARDGIGLLGGQGTSFTQLLRDAGLRVEQEHNGIGRAGFRYLVYPGGSPAELAARAAAKAQKRTTKAAPPPTPRVVKSSAETAATKDSIVAYIAEHPGTSGADALRALDLNPRLYPGKYLADLGREGRLRKEGERQDSKWFAT
jgi:hypothetical protein